MYQQRGLLQIAEAEQELILSLDQAFILFDRENSPQSPTRRAQLATAASNLEVESSSHFSEQLRNTVAQEVKRKHMLRPNEATQQTVENDLLDLFITGTAKIGDEMRNAPCQYIETVLRILAKKGTLDKFLDRSIER